MLVMIDMERDNNILPSPMFVLKEKLGKINVAVQLSERLHREILIDDRHLTSISCQRSFEV